MPLYMDTHQHIEGLTADAVAHAHEADLKTQENWPSVQKTTWFLPTQRGSARSGNTDSPCRRSWLTPTESRREGSIRGVTARFGEREPRPNQGVGIRSECLQDDSIIPLEAKTSEGGDSE